jgi:hypothetical protein
MEDDERARWAKIAAALVTPEMKKQATAWEAERLIMLEIVANFWKVEAQNFKNFVENTANSDNVSAIVLTALEDIPEVRYKVWYFDYSISTANERFGLATYRDSLAY